MSKKVVPLLLLMVMTVVLCCFASGWKSDTAHVYPDIKTFNSSAAGKQACYVSAEEAENMTTRALVETVLTYPYLADMHAFDLPDLWFRGAKDSLPMLKELCSREDALTVLHKQAENVGEDILLRMNCATLIACMERIA